jgi:phage shock protein A
MERRFDDLNGMNEAQAKEYIFRHLATLKVYEKDIAALNADLEKWNTRAGLAKTQGIADLGAEAEKQAALIQAKIDRLSAEASELKTQIETMRRGLTGVTARQRTIDPDLLEQEFRIALGEDLSKDERPDGLSEAQINAQFAKLSAESEADAALAALKAKMRQ